MAAMVLGGPALCQSVTIDGCLGKGKNGGYILNGSGFENSYRLIGKTSGLFDQIGDELKVTGVLGHAPRATGKQGSAMTTLRVKSIETIVHQIRNQTPNLGPLADWKSFADQKYGVRVKYPKIFETAPGPYDGSQTNFIPKAAPTTLISLEIPRETYPNTTFGGGSLDISVGGGITHEGTCRQFELFDPRYLNTKTIGGHLYGHATTGDASMGSDTDTQTFHTFQNGICYEFAFSFYMRSHNGLDLICSVHWFDTAFENALIEAVLSQVSFSTPLVARAPAAGQSEQPLPKVDSFDFKLKTDERSSSVTVTWSTEGTDYVQLTNERVKGLLATSDGTTGNCGGRSDHNLPPKADDAIFSGELQSSDGEFHSAR